MIETKGKKEVSETWRWEKMAVFREPTVLQGDFISMFLQGEYGL